MTKAVIFDCFGVLVGDGLEIAVQKLEKTDPNLRDFVKDSVRQANSGHLSFNELRTMIASRMNLTTDEWFEQIRGGEARNQQVIDLLKSLRPRYKTAVLSNVPKRGLEERFTAEELRDWFDVTVASSDVGVMKPDPEVYRLTAERLGVAPEECVFIDDREVYAEGARAVGMKAICFESYVQMKRELDGLLT